MTNMPNSTQEMDVVRVATELSHELLELIRQRIATHFYDDVRVIEDVARTIASLPMQFM